MPLGVNLKASPPALLIFSLTSEGNRRKWGRLKDCSHCRPVKYSVAGAFIYGGIHEPTVIGYSYPDNGHSFHLPIVSKNGPMGIYRGPDTVKPVSRLFVNRRAALFFSPGSPGGWENCEGPASVFLLSTSWRIAARRFSRKDCGSLFLGAFGF